MVNYLRQTLVSAIPALLLTIGVVPLAWAELLQPQLVAPPPVTPSAPATSMTTQLQPALVAPPSPVAASAVPTAAPDTTQIQTTQQMQTTQQIPIPPQQVMAPPPPSPMAPPSTAQQMSLSQFQQWLQSNGYAQDGKTTTPQPPGTSSSAPPAVIPAKGQRIPLTYEQGQQVMLETLPAPKNPPNADSSLAFNAMLAQNMPLSPQQVLQLRQQIDVAQRAAATPPNIPPKPISSTIMVNLAPGTTPPAIRLAQGYVSALVFVDSTSQPWPIAAFDIGNPKAVNIQWDGKSNILLLQAVAAYSDGDIVIRLVGHPTPITLQLVSGQRVVDYRVDLHVPGIGPNTKEVPMGTGLPNDANQLLLGVLDGISPAGSRTLTVRGADAQAWLLGDKMYLRTRLTLLSPGWVGTMVSPDGMHAYELPKTSSVLVSRYGEPAELKIEGF